MKSAAEITNKDDRGFSLIELLIVLGIFSLLLTIAAIPTKGWLDKSKAESQMRIMHADLLQARTKAMETGKHYFVVIKAGSGSNYQIIQDFNDNYDTMIVPAPDATDLAHALPATPLRYPATASVTLRIDPRGLITSDTSSFSKLSPIFFDTASTTPEYDCFQIYATRISIGRKDGTTCDAR